MENTEQQTTAALKKLVESLAWATTFFGSLVSLSYVAGWIKMSNALSEFGASWAISGLSSAQILQAGITWAVLPAIALGTISFVASAFRFDVLLRYREYILLGAGILSIPIIILFPKWAIRAGFSWLEIFLCISAGLIQILVDKMTAKKFTWNTSQLIISGIILIILIFIGPTIDGRTIGKKAISSPSTLSHVILRDKKIMPPLSDARLLFYSNSNFYVAFISSQTCKVAVLNTADVKYVENGTGS